MRVMQTIIGGRIGPQPFTKSSQSRPQLKKRQNYRLTIYLAFTVKIIFDELKLLISSATKRTKKTQESGVQLLATDKRKRNWQQ